MNELVSIIIPVYNIENYLEECINSVEIQTYKNLEIILIDDGSSDKSGELCDEYAVKDDRVKVIHKKNGGLSEARNVGIETATGEYLYFLDGDDVIPTCTIEKLLNACENAGADVAFSGMKRFFDELPQLQNNENIMVVLDKTEAIRRMLLNDGCGHEACAKLYKKIIWENERFPKGKIYEDYATLYKIMSKCKKIVILQENLYWYRIRKSSIMHSGITQKNMQLLDISQEVTDYLEKNVPEVKEEARYLQMVTYLKLMKRILDNGFNSFLEEQARIRKYVESCRPLLKKQFAKKKDILKAQSLLRSKHLFYMVYSLGERINMQKK